MENSYILSPERCRELLEDRRLGYVGDKTGLSYMCLRNFQKGGNPSLTTLVKLTHYFATEKKEIPDGTNSDKNNSESLTAV
jgi:hypothetical protein